VDGRQDEALAPKLARAAAQPPAVDEDGSTDGSGQPHFACAARYSALQVAMRHDDHLGMHARSFAYLACGICM
jgi:hypothetical protein